MPQGIRGNASPSSWENHLRDTTPPPPNRLPNSADFADLFCRFFWLSEFRRFVVPSRGVSVIWPIRSADLLGLPGF